MHGPVTLVGKAFPILAFAQPDAARPSMIQVLADLTAKGATVIAAGDDAARKEVWKRFHALAEKVLAAE